MNNTSTWLTHSAECKFDTMESRVDAFLFIFISFFAIIGNLIVFICYYQYRPLRRITNVYILSLSASDLLVAALTVPFSFAMFLCNSRLEVDEMEVQRLVYLICDMVPSILSIYALALVAVDRAIAISKPFWHRKHVNNNRASFVVFVMWLYVFGLVACVFIITDESYTLFIVILAYALPVTIMILSYLLMGYVAKKHAKELASLERTKSRLRSGSISRSSDASSTAGGDSQYTTLHSIKTQEDVGAPLVSAYHERRENGNTRSNFFRSSIKRFSVRSLRMRSTSVLSGIKVLKRELKAALTLSLILGCFIISWTPFIALNIEYYRCPTCFIDVHLVKYFKILHFSNSALNPVLFILLNKRWRAAFSIVVLRKKKNRGCSFTSTDTNTSTSGMSGW